MREKIINELKRIEGERNVKILYACESGSRAWGFPSRDSDYDVRFIYIHPQDWYLSIADKRDVIEVPINDLLDINGWDLRKALKLFRKSNPPLLEWLQSPIVYWETSSVVQRIRELSPLTFAPRSCINHYLSMAKGNFREYLQADQVKVKKYFYVLRPVLACTWIRQFNSMPPVEFEVMVAALIMDAALKQAIQTLLARKRAGEELDREPRIEIINRFLEGEIANTENYLRSVERPEAVGEEVYDRIFKEALAEVSS